VYPPYELDHYVYTKGYYELNVFFKNNELELDSVNYMRVSVKHRLIDGNLLGEKLFPVSKNAAIDTLKKCGGY
jgi:hypothetical protein